jgi:hypothetical protein
MDRRERMSAVTRPAVNPNPPPMPAAASGFAAVHSLLAAVRRRLWRERFVQAARTALWAWAAILAAAAALHLAVGQPGFGIALAVGAGAWLVALAGAALRRPSESESALFADRFLVGESAYSTWLEARSGGDAADTPALHRLAQWTAAAVPASRRALDTRQSPLRLVRPLAAAGICTAVAALVTALPAAERTASGDPARAARTVATPVEAPSLGDDALARELAAELATPASTSVGPGDPGRGSMGQAGREDAPPSAAMAHEPGAAEPGTPRDGARRATGEEAAVAAAADASPAGTPGADPGADDRSGSAATRDAGSGREAGTSRDELAATDGSRALQGALAVQRRDVTRPGDEAARQADMTQAGIYDGGAATANGAPVAAAAAAAARPPAAQREAALSPAETAYVTAWAAAARAARAEQR